MANLPESATFDAGIYQIEIADPVLGGVDGISNAQAKGLANRTVWLKQQVDALNALKGKGILAFSAANSYAGGDQVIYQKNIWQANTAISPGAFNPANWTRQLGKLAAIDDTITDQLILQRSGTLNDLNTAALQLQAANDAIMWFHRPGVYSVGFGLDANNKLVYGGSGSTLGTVNEIYHQANCPVSFAANGYQKLASGLIIQFGKGTINYTSTNAWQEQTITLPTSYPNAHFSFVANLPQNMGTQNHVSSCARASSLGTGTIGIFAANAASRDFNYISIGY